MQVRIFVPDLLDTGFRTLYQEDFEDCEIQEVRYGPVTFLSMLKCFYDLSERYTIEIQQASGTMRWYPKTTDSPERVALDIKSLIMLIRSEIPDIITELLGAPTKTFKGPSFWWSSVKLEVALAAQAADSGVQLFAVYAYPEKVEGGQLYDICFSEPGTYTG